jgi:hypothetical protein
MGVHTQVAIISENDPRYPLDRRLVAPRSVLEAIKKRQVSMSLTETKPDFLIVQPQPIHCAE